MTTTAKRIGTLLLASAVAAGVANTVHPRRIPWVQDWSRQVEARARTAGIRVVPFSAVRTRLGRDAVFIDARPAEEYAAGQVRGAVSIPFHALEAHYGTVAELIDSGQTLVAYCSNRECDDALMLATELQAMGATNLLLYVDGFDDWQRRGGPVEAAP